MKKYLAIFIIAITVFSGSLAYAKDGADDLTKIGDDQTKDQTIAALQVQIQNLLAIIAQFKNGSKPTDTNTNPGQEKPLFSKSVPCGLALGTVKYGSSENKKEDVLKLQSFLMKNGYMKDHETGEFDSDTLDAVKNFQKKQGIEATGFVGTQTRGKMSAFVCPTKPITIDVPQTGGPSFPGDLSPKGVKVSNPNGGETWAIGKNYTVQYDSKNSGGDGNARIYLTRDYPTISSKKGINSAILIGTTPDSQNFSYTVSGSDVSSLGGVGSGFRVEVCANSTCSIGGISAQPFTITGDANPIIPTATTFGVKIYTVGNSTLIGTGNYYNGRLKESTVEEGQGQVNVAWLPTGTTANLCAINVKNQTTGQTTSLKGRTQSAGVDFVSLPDASVGQELTLTVTCKAKDSSKTAEDTTFIKVLPSTEQ